VKYANRILVKVDEHLFARHFQTVGLMKTNNMLFQDRISCGVIRLQYDTDLETTITVHLRLKKDMDKNGAESFVSPASKLTASMPPSEAQSKQSNRSNRSSRSTSVLSSIKPIQQQQQPAMVATTLTTSTSSTTVAQIQNVSEHQTIQQQIQTVSEHGHPEVITKTAVTNDHDHIRTKRGGMYFTSPTASFGSVMLGSIVRTKIVLANATNEEVSCVAVSMLYNELFLSNLICI
jgi:hypothetical protein